VFVELKCKSNFSFLRGASDARDYIARASELGIPAIGITDVNGVYGLPRAFEATRSFPQVKLICGAELKLEGHPPLTLIAPDRESYGVLCRLLSAAHADKPKGAAILTFAELLGQLERKQSLIALPDLSEKTNLALLKEAFGDRLSLPLCRYLDGLDDGRTRLAHELSRRYGIPIVATNDVHYHVSERRMLQDCLVCIREGVGYRDAGFHLFGNEERCLKSPFEMAALFRDLPEALQRTCDLAERCTFSLSELKYTYPTELIPEGYTPQTYLEKCVFDGALRRYAGRVPGDVSSLIRHELGLIRKLDYASYFLTIYDIVEFANRSNIVCQGRGSAANSICCYCLGITAIDPIRMNLLFERFISEERGEPPDIDVDFEHERREEVIQYIYSRYGRDRAGMVSAVRTYRSKSAFLELSKAIGVQTGTITAYDLKRKFGELAGADADKLPLVESLMEELKDFPRHLSIHSGGFTLSADPIIETVPVEPARMEDRTIIQWDKSDLDTTGLLKVDVLALGFLTALHKVCDLLGKDWRELPPEDAATYDMICRAETDGTFQIESRAQKSMLPRTRPRCFYDLVVQVAIVRPGPNVGNMVRPYVERREMERRGTPYRVPDPDLEPILGRTYGVPIFQEQIMKLAIVKGGFTPGEADRLRRALAAFRSAEAVEAVGKTLYERLVQNGTPGVRQRVCALRISGVSCGVLRADRVQVGFFEKASSGRISLRPDQLAADGLLSDRYSDQRSQAQRSRGFAGAP
jgi:error-prone DNA polymerase